MRNLQNTLTSLLCGLLAVQLLSAAAAATSTPLAGMIELTVDGETIEGRPIAWNAHEVHLLGRDGRLWSFDPQKAKHFRQTAQRFKPYSPSQIRAMLLRELGDGFEVTGSSHYMIAHRKGERDKWAERFEDLYRTFVRFFSVRGFELHEPPFPLIGIVCRNQEEFMRVSARQGMPALRGILGYYSMKTNRITLFDQGDGGQAARDWQTTSSTVIHEATHQVAFNTGINSRYFPPPLWLAEGLATLFEAPGLYDADDHRTRQDRINRVRFTAFKKIPQTSKGKLPASLVESDKLFRFQPGVAYAESWALTFYLLETRPSQFAAYIKKTISHPPFTTYTATQRTDDFTSIFGSDWQLFDAQFTRYMSRLR